MAQSEKNAALRARGGCLAPLQARGVHGVEARLGDARALARAERVAMGAKGSVVNRPKALDHGGGDGHDSELLHDIKERCRPAIVTIGLLAPPIDDPILLLVDVVTTTCVLRSAEPTRSVGGSRRGRARHTLAIRVAVGADPIRRNVGTGRGREVEVAVVDQVLNGVDGDVAQAREWHQVGHRERLHRHVLRMEGVRSTQYGHQLRRGNRVVDAAASANADLVRARHRVEALDDVLACWLRNLGAVDQAIENLRIDTGERVSGRNERSAGVAQNVVQQQTQTRGGEPSAK